MGNSAVWLTQKNCITFVQRRPNVFDAGPTLYKCYTKVFVVSGCSSHVAHSWHNHNVTLCLRSPTRDVDPMLDHSWASVANVEPKLDPCVCWYVLTNEGIISFWLSLSSQAHSFSIGKNESNQSNCKHVGHNSSYFRWSNQPFLST